MSGFIGATGSKSGLIGHTEIDYQHGGFYVTHGTFNLSNNYARYVKLGHLVYCTGFLKFGATATSSAHFSGLPFKSRGDAANNCGGSFIFHEINLYGTHSIPRVVNNNTTFTFYCCTDDGGWNDTLNVNANDQAVWMMWYMTEK